MAEFIDSCDLCPRCHSALDFESVALCRDCDWVFHAADCIDLHECPGRKQRDEEKLAAWTAASGGDDA